MSILEKFTKQPAETQDYDIDYTDYLKSMSDTPLSFTVSADAGITVVASMLVGKVVKVYLSGGVDGTSYKVTALLTTAGGRVKEGEILIKVKEV